MDNANLVLFFILYLAARLVILGLFLYLFLPTFTGWLWASDPSLEQCMFLSCLHILFFSNPRSDT